MGRGACQLGRTAGVETGEEESGGSISGGRERTWEKGRFVATGAMRELRQGFWAFHAMWAVQSGELLYADVSGRSLQRAQGRMSSHKYSFKGWFGDEIERSFSFTRCLNSSLGNRKPGSEEGAFSHPQRTVDLSTLIPSTYACSRPYSRPLCYANSLCSFRADLSCSI